jgi:hypothetical protein
MITEWSITSSAGASGLTLPGSPPSSVTASRMVARSTTHGTPVKSCMITRAGVNWISVSGSAVGSQPASARTWSAVTLAPSSVRSRFSSSTFRLNGSRSAPSTADSRKISCSAPPAWIVPLAPKLSLLATMAVLLGGGGRVVGGARRSLAYPALQLEWQAPIHSKQYARTV